RSRRHPQGSAAIARTSSLAFPSDPRMSPRRRLPIAQATFYIALHGVAIFCKRAALPKRQRRNRRKVDVAAALTRVVSLGDGRDGAGS
ncbi:hypothetical protein ABTF02_18175, partial [Acinetobacter baumannii]